MPNLSIKNVPDDVVARLRARAQANHRSLQGELLDLACMALEMRAPLATFDRKLGKIAATLLSGAPQ